MIDAFLQPFIINSNVILDIGAHIGYHSIAYSKINPNARIYAFEPQKKIFDLLCENLQANRINNVSAFNNAVANKEGIFSLSNTISDGLNPDTPIEYGTDKGFNFGGMSLGKDGEFVVTVAIDEMDLGEVDFIKIDVEGAESLVISGAIETLKRYKPVICFESNFKTITEDMRDMFGYTDNKTPKQLLKEIGYNTFVNIPNDNIIAIFE